MSNATETILSSAARTASGQSDAQSNWQYRGVRLYLDVSAVSGTSPTLDAKVQTKDPVSGTWVDLPNASFAQKTGAGTDTLVIFPGVTATANRGVSDALDKNWRIDYTIGGTSPSFTFSVGAVYIV